MQHPPARHANHRVIRCNSITAIHRWIHLEIRASSKWESHGTRVRLHVVLFIMRTVCAKEPLSEKGLKPSDQLPWRARPTSRRCWPASWNLVVRGGGGMERWWRRFGKVKRVERWMGWGTSMGELNARTFVPWRTQNRGIPIMWVWTENQLTGSIPASLPACCSFLLVKKQLLILGGCSFLFARATGHPSFKKACEEGEARGTTVLHTCFTLVSHVP